MPTSPAIEITYCRLCGWGLRAGWMAQELLTTFATEVGSVTLMPDATGGVFEVRIEGELVWSRKEQGRFPDIKEISSSRATASLPVGRLGTPTRLEGTSHASPALCGGPSTRGDFGLLG